MPILPAPVGAVLLRRLPRSPLPLALAACIAAVTTMPVAAATIVVSSPDDTDPSASTTCTLRQAILSMNAGAVVGNCSNGGGDFGNNDRIRFAATALERGAVPGTIRLADSADTSGSSGGTLVVSATRLAIDGGPWRGSGAHQYPDGVTIARSTTASNRFGILRDIAPERGKLTLRGVALRNGYAWSPLCAGSNDGGGVCMLAADLDLIDSRVSNNAAGHGGAGIAAASGTITMSGCTVDGNTAYLGGGVLSRAGDLSVSSSTFTGNGVWGGGGTFGGAIHAAGTLALMASTITGNVGKRGAGVYVSGAATIAHSRVGDNSSYYHGGGLYVAASGALTLDSSTVHANFARYNGGGAYVAGVLTVANSTISDNSVYRDGAGIVLVRGGVLHMDHATVTHNTAGSGGGIGYAIWPNPQPWTGSATLNHSIVAGNSQSTGSDLRLGSNWSGVGNLLTDTNLFLGPLQDNGGPTPTMLPGAGSAALDAIAPQDCTQATDQRGIARPQGAGCDIGATEVSVDTIFVDGFDAGANTTLPATPS